MGTPSSDFDGVIEADYWSGLAKVSMSVGTRRPSPVVIAAPAQLAKLDSAPTQDAPRRHSGAREAVARNHLFNGVLCAERTRHSGGRGLRGTVGTPCGLLSGEHGLRDAVAPPPPPITSLLIEPTSSRMVLRHPTAVLVEDAQPVAPFHDPALARLRIEHPGALVVPRHH